MYQQSYEEYMRAVLGYPVDMQNTYQRTDDCYSMPVAPYQNYEVENMYPEIYKTIYPKVCNVCSSNSNRPITEETIQDMTNEVYDSLEIEGKLSFYLKVENRDETSQTVNNRNSTIKKTEERETRQRNSLLQDLIRILILRELFNRPPVRPPFPGPGPRPPMPPAPGPRPPRSPFPGPRPPMGPGPVRPRDF